MSRKNFHHYSVAILLLEFVDSVLFPCTNHQVCFEPKSCTRKCICESASVHINKKMFVFANTIINAIDVGKDC